MHSALERERRAALLRHIRKLEEEKEHRRHLRVKSAVVVVHHGPGARAPVVAKNNDSEHMWWKIGLTIFFIAIIVCACILYKDDSAPQT